MHFAFLKTQGLTMGNNSVELKGRDDLTDEIESSCPQNSRWGAAVQITGLTFGFSALLLVAAWTYFGSLEHALIYISGDRLVLTPSEAYYKDTQAGNSVKTGVTIVNLTGEPVQILGYKASCYCTKVDDLPVEIPPNGQVEVFVSTDTSGMSGSYSYNVTLNTGYTRSPFLHFAVLGRIVE